MTNLPMKMRRRRKQQETGGFFPLLTVALIGVALFSWQVSVLFMLGLLPTIVLAVTGKGEFRSQKLQCVGFSNIAGILPFAVQIWARPRELWSIALDPINLTAMLGSAAIGYALLYVGPMVAAQVLQVMAQDKLKQVAQQRQSLIELWGPEVLGGNEDEGQDPSWVQNRRATDKG